MGMMVEVTLCVVADDCRGVDLAGNQIPPRDVWDGGYLCGPCKQRMARAIAELPATFDDLALLLAAIGGGGEKVTSSPDPGIELNNLASEARLLIKSRLCGWARIVVEERGLSAPTSDDPHTVAAWLVIHVDWLAHQPFAIEPYREFDEIRRDGWSIAHPSGRRRFAVTPCPKDDCTGTLIVWLSQTDDLFPSVLVCDVCDYQLSSERWVSVLVKGRVA